MAINWSAEYPGQIGVDPGWPYGKPRNVAVPGDGTGTPLEAAWVSDLAGWQAALLQEAGITPSGDPDKLGASDYTEAIKTIASSNLAGFTSTEHTWTAQQKFTAAYIANSFGVSGEVLYCDPVTGVVTPKTRVTTHIIDGGGSIVRPEYYHIYRPDGGVTLAIVAAGAVAPAPSFVHPLKLPIGSRLLSYRILANRSYIGGTPVVGRVRFQRLTYDWATPALPVATTISTFSTSANPADPAMVIIPGNSINEDIVAGVNHQFVFDLVSPFPDNCFVRFGPIELTWLDYGPSNPTE